MCKIVCALGTSKTSKNKQTKITPQTGDQSGIQTVREIQENNEILFHGAVPRGLTDSSLGVFSFDSTVTRSEAQYKHITST